MTTPANPLTGAIVTVEVPVALTLVLTVVGFAVMAKSWTTSVTVTEWERLALVPVTETCLVPDDVNVQESVELPEPVTLDGAILHDDVVLVARLTIPAKPFTEAIVIVADPEAFTFTLRLFGLAAIVKSWTTNVIVTKWDRGALAPVTATCRVPADGNVHESVEAPEPVTLVGEMVHEVLLVARLTVPPKPFRPLMVTVDVPAEAALAVTLVGLAVIVKSWTTNVTVVLWDRLALVAVTPTWNVLMELNVHDRVALPEPVTLVGDREHDEVTFVERLTTPPNPFTGLIVTVEAPAALTSTLTLTGLAVIAKSCTM
jgi:hypothetical protein